MTIYIHIHVLLLNFKWYLDMFLLGLLSFELARGARLWTAGAQ